MKKIILLATAFTSLSILSCPDLDGSYQCTQKNSLGEKRSFSMVIKQNGVNLQFSRDGLSFESFKADGVTREYETMGQVLSMTLTCESDAIFLETQGDISMSGLEYTVNSSTIMRKNGPILTQEMETTAMENRLSTSVRCKQI